MPPAAIKKGSSINGGEDVRRFFIRNIYQVRMRDAKGLMGVVHPSTPFSDLSQLAELVSFYAFCQTDFSRIK